MLDRHRQFVTSERFYAMMSGRWRAWTVMAAVLTCGAAAFAPGAQPLQVPTRLLPPIR